MFNLISFAKTDIIVKASHSKILLPIGVIYGYSNYRATMKMGQPVYDFIPWTGIESPLIIAALTFFCVVVFVSLAYISETIKRGKK